MKRFTKIALTFFGIFFVLGMVFCTAGWVMGYQPGQLLKPYRTEGPDKSGSRETLAEAAEFQDVSSVRISAGVSACDISSYSGDTVRIEVSDRELLACEQNGEELEISYAVQEHSLWRWMTKEDNGTESIHVFVPKKLFLEGLYVDAGVSGFNVEGVRCKELELTCGAGKFSFSGEVTEDCFVECGVGSVELLLAGSEEDFNYSLACGLGKIEIQNGPEIAGVGEYTKDNQSRKNMELECGLGSITVKFQEI